MQVALLRAMAAFDKGMTFAKKETIEEAKDRLDYLSSRHSLCARNNNKQRFKFCCSTSRMFKTFASTSTDVAGDSLRGSGTAGGAENDDGDDDDDDEEHQCRFYASLRYRPASDHWVVVSSCTQHACPFEINCQTRQEMLGLSIGDSQLMRIAPGCPSATAS